VAVRLSPGSDAPQPETRDDGRIQLALHGRCAELRLAGELDIASVGALERVAAQLAVGERDTVVVDLAAATFADSSFVAWLIGLSRRVDARSADMVVLVAPGRVRDLLQLTGVSRVLTVVEDGDERARRPPDTQPPSAGGASTARSS
jgi:stage II sporulation protein AA (anti-sigma F factor antagonist)